MQLRKSSIIKFDRKVMIDPLKLTPEDIELLIGIAQQQNKKDPDSHIVLKAWWGKQYYVELRDISNNNPAMIQVGLTKPVIVQPVILISPAKPSDNAALLKQLINVYSNSHMLPARHPVTGLPQNYLVPIDVGQKIVSLQLIHLSQDLIRFPRKQNPDEYRYAVCKKKLLATGAHAKAVISDRTLKFTGADKALEVKLKSDDKKRLVKSFFVPVDEFSAIKTDKKTKFIDRSEQNITARREADFVGRNKFFHAKKAILSKDNNSPAIIMRVAKGIELRKYLYDDKHGLQVFNVDQRIALCIMIGEAIIEQAHKKFMVHRDIKPENLILHAADDLTPISITLVDFGLTADVEEADNVQQCCTPGYIAPEFFSAQPTDQLSDSYSFAKMLSLDLWNDMSDKKHDGLADQHKVMILAVMITGTQEDRYGRASVTDIVEVFRKIQTQRKLEASTQTNCLKLPM